MEILKIHYRPELSNPVLIAAWPGIGNVALRAITYLKDKLGAIEFGEIDASYFFDPSSVLVSDNLICAPEFPTGKFYFWSGSPQDIIFFISDAQPILKQYELANLILDFAEEMGVRRVYTCAAAIIPEKPEKFRVWGAATEEYLLRELERYDVALVGEFRIRGLNGLLLSAAKVRGMEGICLLGETPQAVAEFENPRASLMVLEVLTRILGLEIDMSELEAEVKRIEAEIERISKEALSKFIDHFTKPIWERKKDGENE